MAVKNEEFVIIETGGKQYIVEENSIISVEKLPESKSKTITFDTVLLHSKGGKLAVGSPYVKLNVKAEILANEVDKKVRVFKFKPKTGYKKKQGHRQTYTTIKITSIGSSSTTTSAKSTDDKKTSKPTSDKKEVKKTESKPAATKSASKTSASKKKTSSEKKS
ncbi:50S ribosomal protein L21 [bacterium]|nr:50S ribosomal protein L21 [Actinomycetota bacterium]MBE32934.1 50S ribosomal protein L21 [bacterium]